jgi:hypothetical protein
MADEPSIFSIHRSVDPPYTNQLHQTVGKAIASYARVERMLTLLLGALLNIDTNQAHVVFFAIQNTRSRNEMFEALLTMHFKGAVKKYWDSCGAYLLALATFRNAIAHWHPYENTHLADPAKREATLQHPVPESNYKSIGVDEIAPFLADCRYIQGELTMLVEAVRKSAPSTLPEKFQQPIAHRNQALLQPRRKPKAQQPQRPPSRASGLHKGRKPSARQRRERALARRTKKR